MNAPPTTGEPASGPRAAPRTRHPDEGPGRALGTGPDQASALRALAAEQRASAPPNPDAGTARGRSAAGSPPRGSMIVLASGKGGVGKTSLAVNLAIALARLRRRVLLVDADLGMANADVLCGLSPRLRLDRVITGTAGGGGRLAGAGLASLATPTPWGFDLIAGAAGVARAADLGPASREALVASIRDMAGARGAMVLVDCGAGLSPSILDLVRAGDRSIVVTTPEPTAITDAYALIKCALTSGPEPDPGHEPRPDPGHEPDHDAGGWLAAARRGSIGLLVNMAASESEAVAVHRRMAAVCARFLGYPLPLSGWVCRDDRVPEATRSRTPLLAGRPGSAAGRRIRAIAAEIGSGVVPGHGPGRRGAAAGVGPPSRGRGWLRWPVRRDRAGVAR